MRAELAEFYSQVSDGEPGEIIVRATKEEWQAVIDHLFRTFREPEGAPAELIHWLINQGVYE